MSSERRGPSATTVVAAVLIFVETAFWIFVGAAMLLAAHLLGGDGDDSVSFIPIAVDAVRGIFAVIGTLILLLCAATIVAGVGILRRRAWVRWTGVVLFSVFGLMVLASIISALNNPEAVGMAMSSLFFFFDAVIVVLLALPGTGRDFRPTAVAPHAELQGPSAPPTL